MNITVCFRMSPLKFHSKELHNLCYLPDVMRIKRAKNIVHMMKTISIYKYFIGALAETRLHGPPKRISEDTIKMGL
jgi:hypothetical protein